MKEVLAEISANILIVFSWCCGQRVWVYNTTHPVIQLLNHPHGGLAPPCHLPGGLVEREKQRIGLGRAGGLLSLILPRDQQKNRTMWLLGHPYYHWVKNPLGEGWKIQISLLNILGDSGHQEEGEFFIGSLSFLLGFLSLSERLQGYWSSIDWEGKGRQRASPGWHLMWIFF